MDNQGTESSGNEALSIDGATQAFSSMFDGEAEQTAKDLEKKEGEEGAQDPEEDKPDPDEPEAEEPAEPKEESGEVTIEVDGKTVTLTKEELAEAYKNGLRQSDYTKKTMEVAEQRKAADAEMQKAYQERQHYAEELNKFSAQIEGALDEFKNVDWRELSVTDPVEYIRLQHLFNERQSALQKVRHDQQMLKQIDQQEYVRHMKSVEASEFQQMLEKVPEWKDPKKFETERVAVRNYMLENGFDEQMLANLYDHKAVILSRKAMLHDAMMAKANAASKKVAELPQKVLKPGSGEKPDTSSNKQNMERLKKSGSVLDAASVFKGLI